MDYHNSLHHRRGVNPPPPPAPPPTLADVERLHQIRMGASSERGYSSSSDEGHKVRGGQGHKMRGGQGEYLTSAGGGGKSSRPPVGGERWAPHHQRTMNNHYTGSDMRQGLGEKGLDHDDPRQQHQRNPDLSNGPMRHRLYSYLSGSDEEAGVNATPPSVSHGRQDWKAAPRGSGGGGRRNSGSSPVDVSSPSWVHSPSDDDSCDSETDHEGIIPRMGESEVDGISRFGENIYSRIKMDQAAAMLSHPINQPSPSEVGHGPLVPPRRLDPTSAKRPSTNSTNNNNPGGLEIRERRSSTGQRGLCGGGSGNGGGGYYEPDDCQGRTSSGNALYEPSGQCQDRSAPPSNVAVPTFPRTVPCGAAALQQKHHQNRSSVTEANIVSVGGLCPRTGTLPAPPMNEGADHMQQSPTTGTVPLWRRQDRVAGEMATSTSAERQNSPFSPNVLMLPSSTAPSTVQTYPPPVAPNDFRRYSSHFSQVKQRAQKHLRNGCTWKCAAILFVVLSVVLLFLISYFITMKIHNLSWNLEKISASDSDNSSLSPVSGDISSLSSLIMITIGKLHSQSLLPYSFLRCRFYLPEGTFVRFNFSFSVTSLLGVYSARNVPPSHTRYDFLQILDGRTPTFMQTTTGQRSPRSTDAKVNSSFLNYLEDGLWYVYIYNDCDEKQTINFILTLQDAAMSSPCPRGCHGRGECIDGQCHCFAGFTGWDCKQSVCPVLCNNNGVYVAGECKCYQGWKGKECELPSSQCEDPTCGGNGKCFGGTCVCAPGYKGLHCHEVDCLFPNCSDNGVCTSRGQCRCFNGFWGSDCSLHMQLNNVSLCVRDCSWHGVFDFSSQSCLCESGWNGSNCQIEICNIECIHGWCEKQRCICEKGWTGQKCDAIECDGRCAKHGFCDNGTCTCKPGWNGRHCSLDGCPNSCNNHGTCQMFHGTWRCSCRDGWKGSACEVAMEIDCEGKMDEDRDGLTDCFDPDCCMSISCKDNDNCGTAPDPMEILLRKQPPSSAASFYDRMRFLIEDESVQSYATLSSFNQSQVSVIRGKVISRDGSPLIGVRVGVITQPLYGFTRTRDLGLFDILVNGGGSVTVSFQRQPFKTKQMTVMVPWNRMVTMETVTLVLEDEDELVEEVCAQGTHDHYKMKPVVLSTWQHTQLAACPSKSTIIPESQVLQESLKIPGTGLFLVYHSSHTPGYMSTILIQLTPQFIPLHLAVVHVRILVEGLVYERVFEADPDLRYKFAWDRRNAYNQKVYGIVTASVGVGYQYNGCSKVFWEMQSATMSSYDITSSEIGGWNLHIHHTYNFQEGILHKGDGTNIYLKEQTWKSLTILGDGTQRRMDCRGCDGKAEDVRLMAPVALASGRDGSIYVGDYNHIRKLAANREEMTSILQLSMPDVPYKYFMTVSPVDGKLYISDHQSLRILRVKTMGAVRELTINYEVIAGTGDQCVPGEKEMCGDGGPAVNARLNYPKGIAIDKDGLVYFADGANIRMIDESGLITTLIGSQGHPKYWQPLACHRVISVDEVTLHWPTSLAVNPLDNSLNILDNNMVLKITDDHMVLIVAGRPLHCPPRNANSGLLHDEEQAALSLATDSLLTHPQHISYAPNGELYIVESNGKDVNQVRAVDTDGKIMHYAGGKSNCDCQKESCKCYKRNEELSTNMLLNNPTAITVTPDYVVHVADMGNLRIHSVFPPLPTPDRQGQYEVMYPQTQEMYVFNRYGQHIATKDLITGHFVYNFTYNVNSYYGKLMKIVDASGNVLTILRDYKLQAKELLPPGGQKCRFMMDSMGQLQVFTASDNSTTWFTYFSNTGLLESKETSQGQKFIYEFDNNGRLASVVQPTGEKTVLDEDGRYNQMKNISYQHNSYLAIEYPFNMAVTLEMNPYPLLNTQLPLSFKRKIILPLNLTNTVEWRYHSPDDRNDIRWDRLEDQTGRSSSSKSSLSSGRTDQRIKSSDAPPISRETTNFWGYERKELLVNGENLLTFKFNRDDLTQTILNRRHEEILVVKYETSGRPVRIVSRGGGGSGSIGDGLNVTYDRQSRPIQWNFGDTLIARTYDNKTNHLIERKISNKAIYKYMYRNSNKPTDVILPSGKQYQIHYDEHGNVKSVVMPSLSKHHLYSLTTIGLHRILYRSPESRGLYIRDYDNSGKLHQVSYPSGHRRVNYYHDGNGQMVKIFYDWTLIVYGYHGDTEILHHVNVTCVLEPSEYSCSMTFEPKSSLVTLHSISFNASITAFIDAKFRYSYDQNLRLDSTQAEIGNRTLRPVQFTYDPDLGRMETMSSFSFKYIHSQREITRDKNVEIIREFDHLGRTTDVWYRFNVDDVVFNIEIKYDLIGRLFQWRRKVRTSDLKAYEYVYDIDGNLVEVLENSQSTWKYEYDVNANIVKIAHYGNARRVVVGKADQVESSGQESYIYDRDGFLVQRNSEMFEYNSNGRLERSFQNGRYDIRYYYDGLQRLVARRDVTENRIVQFFYADLEHRLRVTHVFDHSTKKTTSFVYDDRKKLFAMQVESDFFYVALDPSDSPILVMNSVGSVVKQIAYDPLGNPISDSSPEFPLFLGFRCGVVDPVTKLVFIENVIYDPQLGRRMSPNYDQLIGRINQLFWKPESANLYRFDFFKHNIFSEAENSVFDLSSWLLRSGYDLKSLIPRFNFHGMVRVEGQEEEEEEEHQLDMGPMMPVTSAFHCAFDRDMEYFLRLSVVPTSSVMSAGEDTYVGRSLTPLRYLFGQGIVLSVDGERVNVNILDSANEVMVLLATTLLNNSLAVGLRFTVHGRDVHHFVKPSIEDAVEDVKALSLRAEGTIQGLNVTVHRIHQAPDTVKFIDVRLHSNYTLLNLRYGTTIEAERDRVLRHAKQRATEGAWEIEREIIQSKKTKRNVWTKRQEEELVSKGQVDGMVGEYVLDVSQYPELADSPRVVKFIPGVR